MTDDTCSTACQWWCDRYKKATPEAKEMYILWPSGHVNLDAVQPQAPHEALVTAIVKLTEAINDRGI